MSEPMMLEQARLVAAGWKQRVSGRWWHPDLPLLNDRRRMYTVADALALVDVDPSNNTPEEATR